jgi:putative endonuclease
VASKPRSIKTSEIKTSEIGTLAEQVVAQWLTDQGWEILHRRWHCRWGELDLVACSPQQNPSLTQTTIAFIEVKARSRGNWDHNGLLAVDAKKQAKLWQAAELFLADSPHLANCSCRFDVALVTYIQSPRSNKAIAPSPPSPTPNQQLDLLTPVQLGKAIAIANYHLTLQHYIPSAFGT